MLGEIVTAIGLPFREALRFFRRKVRLPTRRWQDNYGRANTRAFSVAGAMSDALLKDFQDEIRKAMQRGMTLAEFQASFGDIVKRHGWEHSGEPGHRAELIFRTNLSTAYSAGRYAQMTEPATLQAFPFWEYVHSGARNFREEHKAWNGLVLRADDPWWDKHYPPNGWNCGCRVRALTRGQLQRRGKEGPDQAPTIETRAWTNKATGKIHYVPVGIDPGFDYNPGKAWLEADRR